MQWTYAYKVTQINATASIITVHGLNWQKLQDISSEESIQLHKNYCSPSSLLCNSAFCRMELVLYCCFYLTNPLLRLSPLEETLRETAKPRSKGPKESLCIEYQGESLKATSKKMKREKKKKSARIAMKCTQLIPDRPRLLSSW